MYLAQGPQDIRNAEVAVILTVILVAAFWRAIVRFVIAAIAAVLIVAIAYGLISFMQAAHP